MPMSACPPDQSERRKATSHVAPRLARSPSELWSCESASSPPRRWSSGPTRSTTIPWRRETVPGRVPMKAVACPAASGTTTISSTTKPSTKAARMTKVAASRPRPSRCSRSATGSRR